MEISTMSTNSRSGFWGGVGIVLGVAVAVALFVLVMGRMGLLNGLLGETAVFGQQTVATKDFKFSQPELRVRVGETVTLRLDNEDMLPHSFDVDELDVHAAMPAKDQAVVTFTPTTPGTYTFYCAVPRHREAGMVGTLIVEP